MALSASRFDQFAVNVSADQYGPVAQSRQQIQHLGRLWARGDVADDHDALGGGDFRFDEHSLQCRKGAMDVGEDGYAAGRGRGRGRHVSHFSRGRRRATPGSLGAEEGRQESSATAVISTNWPV